MKIIGTGVDIVENSRIKKSIANNSFLNRVFTNKEILISKKIKNKTSYFAKRFAAKEAFSKAIGTGFSQGVFWKDISVENNELGKPILKLKGNAKKILKQLVPKNKKPIVNITITDENHIAYAMVIVSFN